MTKLQQPTQVLLAGCESVADKTGDKTSLEPSHARWSERRQGKDSFRDVHTLPDTHHSSSKEIEIEATYFCKYNTTASTFLCPPGPSRPSVSVVTRIAVPRMICRLPAGPCMQCIAVSCL